MIRIGIIGGAGYTAGELIRLLLNHPEAELIFVNSTSNAGNPLTYHEGLVGETDMTFTDQLPFNDVDVLFLCGGHGQSKVFLNEHPVPEHVKIIDLAQDFRIKADGNDYVYGLPELQRSAIAGAQHVANPGCFATCIQLALLPLATQGWLRGRIVINAITGSTGAGVKPSTTTHFSWRAGNVSTYKVFSHQHLQEINQTIAGLQPSFAQDGGIDFIPYRGDFARGIFATSLIYRSEGAGKAASMEEIQELYRTYYRDAPFTHYVDNAPDMKQVINTNKALVHVAGDESKILVTSCIDNLLKGASGQAVQNMNLMFNINETAGLKLKSAGF